MSLGILIHKTATKLQSCVVHLIKVVDAVTHVHRNLLPCLETQVAEFQNGLVLGIGDGFNEFNDLTLEVDKVVNVDVYVRLKVNDLADDILHAVEVPRAAGGDITQGGRGFGRQVVQG